MLISWVLQAIFAIVAMVVAPQVSHLDEKEIVAYGLLRPTNFAVMVLMMFT